MPSFRRLVMWLMLLAVPLQAYSAVSMQVRGIGMDMRAVSAAASTPTVLAPAQDMDQKIHAHCGACDSACCHALAPSRSMDVQALVDLKPRPRSLPEQLRSRLEAPPRKPPRS